MLILCIKFDFFFFERVYRVGVKFSKSLKVDGFIGDLSSYKDWLEFLRFGDERNFF